MRFDLDLMKNYDAWPEKITNDENCNFVSLENVPPFLLLIRW